MRQVSVLSLLVVATCVLSGQSAPQTTAAKRVGKPQAPKADQETRVALVIGNGAYGDAPLKNPVNDVRAMAAALKQCGFAVTKLENASRAQMRDGIRAFGAKIAEGGVGLFYFAGHGMAVKGRNYLIPVGTDIVGEDEVAGEAVEVDSILAKMETARNRLNILILDACRNNPFARSFRGTQQGLAQMDAPTGTFVAFATAPGRTAADGTGADGLYTGALLHQLQTPGASLETVFKRTRAEVLQASRQQQTPWENSSIVGDFYFVPEAGSPAPSPVVQPAQVAAGTGGNLQVAINVAEARVFLDGALAGTASASLPLNLRNLPAGDVLVRAEAPGFAPEEQHLGIVPGHWTQTRMTLVSGAEPHEDANAALLEEQRQDKGKWQAAWSGTWQADPGSLKTEDGWECIGSMVVVPSGEDAVSLEGKISISLLTPGVLWGKTRNLPKSLEVHTLLKKGSTDTRINGIYMGKHRIDGTFLGCDLQSPSHEEIRKDQVEFNLLGSFVDGLPKMSVELPGGNLVMLVKTGK